MLLRDVRDDDLRIFFEQERDPIANLLAAYPARDLEAFMLHWRKKASGDTPCFIKTIMFDGCLAGSIECWANDGKWLLGYWIGREFWGKGIATAALREFLTYVKMRPLHAHVPSHNKASLRVLEKCGFTVSGQGSIFSEVHGHDVEEIHFTYHSEKSEFPAPKFFQEI